MFQIGRVGREGTLVSCPLLRIAWFPLTTYIHSYIHTPMRCSRHPLRFGTSHPHIDTHTSLNTSIHHPEHEHDHTHS